MSSHHAYLITAVDYTRIKSRTITRETFSGGLSIPHGVPADLSYLDVFLFTIMEDCGYKGNVYKTTVTVYGTGMGTAYRYMLVNSFLRAYIPSRSRYFILYDAILALCLLSFS